MKNQKKIITLLLTVVMLLGSSFTTFAASKEIVVSAANDTAAYILKTVSDPQVGSVGGEWSIIGLARSDYNVPQSYYDNYYKNVEKYVKDLKGNLHDKKYTEYSRLILALTAIGKEPSNLGGYNLLEPLGDFDKTIWQGINGPIFALIALDCGNYDMPANKSAKTQATREMYIDEILSRQLSDGGFALSGSKADPDITGMALQALAKYQNYKSVKTATDKALTALSELQDKDGGYGSFGTTNSESTVQVLMALCELGIDINDSRFVKNGKTVVDNLLTYYKLGNGFIHTASGEGVDLMSTEQAFYGLVNYQRVSAEKSSLYRMVDKKTDVEPTETPKNTTKSEFPVGLPGKNKDIKALPVVSQGKTFADIKNHKNQTAIEALTARGIINGVSETSYAPDVTMTRAQFSTIVVRTLGLTAKTTGRFTDVPASNSYAAYIDTAFSYGIVNGVTSDTFAPDKTITKQEAAVMISNAAKLCGLNTALETIEIRDMLAQFSDYTSAAEWGRNGLAFCYKEGLLTQDDIEINPFNPVTRADIADMLYLMLKAANLI